MHDAYKMVSKGVFFNGVKHAIRKVSGAAASIRDASTSLRRNDKKVMISRPVLMFTKDSEASLRRLQEAAGVGFDVGTGMDIPRYAVNNPLDGGDRLSTGMGSSPTSSDGSGSNRSVPVQRPDFGPPRATLGSVAAAKGIIVAPPAQVKTKVTKLPKEVEAHLRRRSSDTQHTQSSGDVEEAVIVTASRAPSIRSAHSTYSYVRDSQAHGPSTITMPVPSLPTPTRPRLVQFTSARGVPTPALEPQGGAAAGGANRRISQVAAVVLNGGPGANDEADAIMTDGMRYVQAFGVNQTDIVVEPTRSSNLGRSSSIASQSRRSSRSIGANGSNSKSKLSPSMASTHSPVPTQSTSSYVYPSPSASFDSELNSRGSLVMRRILVRADEQFAFSFPVMLPTTPGSSATGTPASGTSSATSSAGRRNINIVVKLLYGGGPLPKFLIHSIITAPSPKKASSSSSSKKSGEGTVEVEFWGTPGKKDAGEVFVGVFDVSGGQEVCVGKLAVDVVSGR